MNAMNHVGVTMTNDVLPCTNCDLVPIHELGSPPGHSPSLLHDALDYIATEAPDSTQYGSRNVMIGEYGSAENGDEFGGAEAQKEITRRMTDVRPTNAQMRGLWHARPDGTRAPVYSYFQGLMSQSVLQPAVP